MKTCLPGPTEMKDPTKISYPRGISRTCLIICDAKAKLGMEQGKLLHAIPVSLIVSCSM